MTNTRFLGTATELAACLFFAACSLWGQTVNNGSIAGSVSDEGVRPIAGVVVIANREGLPAASGRATSAADGTFQIGGLPVGSYVVCAQVPGGGFVDACEWRTPLTVGVKAGQPVAGLQFPLKRGAILQVRLNDPGQLLLQPSSITKTVPHVLLAVQTARGLLLPVTLVARDATGTTHAVTIPFDTPVNFTVFGDHVSLTDGTGAPAGLGLSTVPVTLPSVSSPPVTPLSGANPIPLTFNVTGPK
jgi:Carboxypeptidase regulatory-like domain